ncbi:MAG: hypothetical protein BWY87_01405 [Deltaproteobacteria bacterium ADurb.Bin510]|nr:MAG: hypothetical protein BWY87_01405 [Deltaproteobacteria bacterium ADurb.Bin510]
MPAERNVNTVRRLLVASSVWLLSYLILFGVILNPLNLTLSAALREVLVGVSAVFGLGSLVSSLSLGLSELQARDANNLSIWCDDQDEVEVPGDGER